MIDSHCHLTHRQFADDVDDVIGRARRAGATACITIGTGIEDALRVRELAEREDGYVFCAAGLDPFTAHDLDERFNDAVVELERIVRDGRFRAVGEIGLDYHYDLGSPAVQAGRLEPQLDLATRLDLPVVIHVREAHQDLAAILERHSRVRGVIHSFTAGPEEATRYLDLGWSLSFNGVVTFKNAEAVREALRLVPEDRLLLETDSPYLAPVPLRGRRCEPAYLEHTLQRVAEVRDAAVESITMTTTENTRRLFGIQPRATDS